MKKTSEVSTKKYFGILAAVPGLLDAVTELLRTPWHCMEVLYSVKNVD